MLEKKFTGLVVPEVKTSRFGAIKEGVHVVVIRDAKRMPQNMYSYAGDDCTIVTGEVKPESIALPCFDQIVTTILFQLKDGTAVIFDHRSDYGWAKKNKEFTSRKSGEKIFLDDAFIQKHGLTEFGGKFYLTDKNGVKHGLEDAAAEQKCFDMLSRVYSAAGLTGQTFDPSLLIGKELKIKVELNSFARPDDKFERYKVTGWYKVDDAVATTVAVPTQESTVVEEPEDMPF